MSTRTGSSSSSSGNTGKTVFEKISLNVEGAAHYVDVDWKREYGPTSRFSSNQDSMGQLHHDLFVQQYACDAVIEMEGLEDAVGTEHGQSSAKVHAHKLFLRMMSGFFRDMLDAEEDPRTAPPLEVHLAADENSVSLMRAFCAALAWCYHQQIPTWDAGLCFSLLCAAYQWRMPKLTEQVVAWSRNHSHKPLEVVAMCRTACECGNCEPVFHEAVHMLATRWDELDELGEEVQLAFLPPDIFCALVSTAVAIDHTRHNQALGRMVGRYLRGDGVVGKCEVEHVEYLSGLLEGVDHDEEMMLLRLCVAVGGETGSICRQIAGKLQVLVDAGGMKQVEELPVDVVVDILSQDEMVVESEDVVLELVRAYVGGHKGVEEEGWEERVYACVRWAFVDWAVVDGLMDGSAEAEFVDPRALMNAMRDHAAIEKGLEAKFWGKRVEPRAPSPRSTEREGGDMQVQWEVEWDGKGSKYGKVTERSVKGTGGGNALWAGKTKLTQSCRWTVRVDRVVKGANSVSVGVAEPDWIENGWNVGYGYYVREASLGFRSNGDVYQHGKKLQTVDGLEQGDHVTMSFDNTENTLSFFRNDVHQATVSLDDRHKENGVIPVITVGKGAMVTFV